MTDKEYVVEKCKKCIDSGFGEEDLMFYYKVLKVVRENEFGGWISVKDKEKLPKGECIAYSNKFDEMMIGYIEEAQDSDTGYLAENEYEFLYNVTHCMPLPESPKGV